ncbi:STAS domain-containing protein [Trinickia sp. Y13]|uniref:STAS domain-containing protein n=1 Tax=Trinickia sp. Y13 TaxID=2917807 RepID=UPI002404E29A|nr:STAS domain-containing protein [Trinickia sp. Y13]MDG0024790.1 STAS domain-containing protein [Trinickia sp. Y13]
MNAPFTVQIELALTIYHAAELKEAMLDALERGPCVRFDLSAVPEIDCAGVQLLVATRRSAADRGQTCAFVGASDPVQATLALLGAPQLLTQAQPVGGTLAALEETVS